MVEGEYQLDLIENLRAVTTASIFAVFHQVPQLLEPLLARAPRNLLHGAVCVARCQIPLVQALAPPGKTLFVPHGVDVDYFTPGGTLS